MASNKRHFFVLLLTISTFVAINGQKRVFELSEDNWKQITDGEWMVKLYDVTHHHAAGVYAPWCPACKGLQPTWRDFARVTDINVGQVDVTTSPGLSGRFIVTALPTIFHVKDGQFRQYTGSKDKDSFVNFIRKETWRSVDAVPAWKAPDSLQMSIVSSFFKLSQILRTVHNHLMEEYGLPTWGSYLIFAIGTIVFGALLGLVLVFIIDLIYPPRVTVQRPKGADDKTDKRDKDSEDELADEEIKDDLLDDAIHSDGEENAIRAAGDAKTTPPASPSVKKRKPRKAD